MPVFLPPKRATKSARAAYLHTYLRRMADNNDKLAEGCKGGHKLGEISAHGYYQGRAAAFREASDCLAQLEL